MTSFTEEFPFLNSNHLDYVYNEEFFDPLQESTLFIGRGPSNYVHLGHYLILKIVKEFNLRQIGIKIQLSCDQKEYRDGVVSEKRFIDSYLKLLKYFNLDNFEIFNNNDSRVKKKLYSLGFKIIKKLNLKIDLIKRLLNYDEKTSFLEYFYTVVQAITYLTFKNKENKILQTIVITADDQIGFFKLASIIAKQLKIKPPIVCVIKKLRSLTESGKMSSSLNSKEVIYVKEGSVYEKIKKAKSGGHQLYQKPTLEQLSEDWCYQWLIRNQSQEETRSLYQEGKLSSIDLKKKTSQEIEELIRIILKE